MRLNHPTIPIGLLFAGVLVLGLAGRIESAAAASGCPCIKGSAGTCVPDLACEARERQRRDRLMYGLQVRPAPYSYRREWGRPSTTAPAPTGGPAPVPAAPSPTNVAPLPRSQNSTGHPRPPPAPRFSPPAPPP